MQFELTPMILAEDGMVSLSINTALFPSGGIAETIVLDIDFIDGTAGTKCNCVIFVGIHVQYVARQTFLLS